MFTLYKSLLRILLSDTMVWFCPLDGAVRFLSKENIKGSIGKNRIKMYGEILLIARSFEFSIYKEAQI